MRYAGNVIYSPPQIADEMFKEFETQAHAVLRAFYNAYGQWLDYKALPWHNRWFAKIPKYKFHSPTGLCGQLISFTRQAQPPYIVCAIANSLLSTSFEKAGLDREYPFNHSFEEYYEEMNHNYGMNNPLRRQWLEDNRTD